MPEGVRDALEQLSRCGFRQHRRRTAWVFTCNLRGVYAHELGHNLGMDHAATPASEYGDATDPMAFGSQQLRPLNAPHRQQLGWLAPGTAQMVTQNGLYDVAPLALDPVAATAPEALTIHKPDTGEYYYLSYRFPVGFDNYIDGTYYYRLSVHRYKGDGSSSKTWLLTGLDDGQSFVDGANGITVTQVSHDSTHATARIEFTATCTVAQPLVALSPVAQTGAPGSAMTYTVSLTNRDTAACAASTFDLTSGVPAGWPAAVSPASVTVAPGATGEAILTVTSAAGAGAGTYPVTVNVADGATVSHGAALAGSYTVAVSCAAAAPAITLSPQTQTATPGTATTYTLSLTNRDTAACAAGTFLLTGAGPAGWVASVAPASLTLGAGATGLATMTVTSAPNASVGTYAAAVNVADNGTSAHSSSESVSYTVVPPCVPGVPVLSASPASQDGTAGATLSYALELANTDTGPCTPSTFVVQPSLPAGWMGALSASSVTLVPGQSSTLVLSVTSVQGAVRTRCVAQRTPRLLPRPSH